MALSESEELELLTLERERGSGRPQKATPVMDNVRAIAPYYLGPAGAVRGVMEASEKLGDIAYEGGGRLTDMWTKLGAPPEVAAVPGVAGNMLINALPTGGVATAAGRLAKSATEGMAKTLMGGAIKSSKQEFKRGDADRAVETMLDYGINVSPGSLNAVKSAISGLDDKIGDLVSNSTGIVDKAAVTKNLKSVIDKFKNQLGSVENTTEVRNALMKFWNHPNLKNGRDIPVKLAHDMKRAFYEELGAKAYSGQARNVPYEAAEKALARGLKEGVERIEPATSPLLSQQSRLINVKNQLENRLPFEASKNPIGLGALATNPAAAAAFAVDRSAFIKSLMARGIYDGAAPTGRLAGAAGISPFLTVDE